MSKLRQGDLFLFNTLDGGEISVINGEPEMDGGLQTGVYLSIDEHDGSPYWGNEYLKQSEKVEGQFAGFIKGVPKSASNILKAQELLLLDLKWFKDDGVADEIIVDITSTDVKRILVTIELKANGETIESNEFEINWGFEIRDPANARL